MGAEILLAPHQTGGCTSKNPHQMGLIERRVWEARHSDPQAIEAELKGDKGRGWLMRWLPVARPRQRHVPGVQQRRRHR